VKIDGVLLCVRGAAARAPQFARPYFTLSAGGRPGRPSLPPVSYIHRSLLSENARFVSKISRSVLRNDRNRLVYIVRRSASPYLRDTNEQGTFRRGGFRRRENSSEKFSSRLIKKAKSPRSSVLPLRLNPLIFNIKSRGAVIQGVL